VRGREPGVLLQRSWREMLPICPTTLFFRLLLVQFSTFFVMSMTYFKKGVNRKGEERRGDYIIITGTAHLPEVR